MLVLFQHGPERSRRSSLRTLCPVWLERLWASRDGSASSTGMLAACYAERI